MIPEAAEPQVKGERAKVRGLKGSGVGGQAPPPAREFEDEDQDDDEDER